MTKRPAGRGFLPVLARARRRDRLGLFIVKGIVEAHHGAIEVDAPVRGGARSGSCLPAGHPPWIESPGP